MNVVAAVWFLLKAKTFAACYFLVPGSVVDKAIVGRDKWVWGGDGRVQKCSFESMI